MTKKFNPKATTLGGIRAVASTTGLPVHELTAWMYECNPYHVSVRHRDGSLYGAKRRLGVEYGYVVYCVRKTE